jgi:two-component system, OmpR family, KDP operon response regulator KdpE
MRIPIVDEDIFEDMSASSSSSKRSGAEILIADENPATLEFFSSLLEDRGFTTLTADSGESALQSLTQHTISVILIGDLMKPPVDGLDLIRRLRRYHIPVVVATSYGADYTLLAKMAGAEVIIHKFADPTYLITTIEGALQQRLVPPRPKIPPK